MIRFLQTLAAALYVARVEYRLTWRAAARFALDEASGKGGVCDCAVCDPETPDAHEWDRDEDLETYETILP